MNWVQHNPSWKTNSFPATQENTNCPTMQAIIKYLHMSHNFDSACTLPNKWIQGTERTMTIVLPSAVFTRRWLTDWIAVQNDVCTVLPLVLQQRTSGTCTDLVQWNCCYPHKHKCSLYNFHSLLTDTPRQIYRGAWLGGSERCGRTEAQKWEAKWTFST